MGKGANYIKDVYKKELSPLGEDVADILHHFYLGLYHAENKELKKMDWSNTYVIKHILTRTLATFDFSHLTLLTVLSHDFMVRIEVSPKNFNYLELMFHKRLTRTGGISERMPTLEDNIAILRKQIEETK